MNKNDMIKWGAIIGGGVLAYWYITSYGPAGKITTGLVDPATGKQALSYWDTWFGGLPQIGTQPITSSTSPGYPNQPPALPPGTTQPVVTQPSQPVATPQAATVRQQILQASAGNPGIQGGYAIPDIWSFYWQQVTGRTISAQQMVQAFPPTSTGQGAPLNLDQFLAALPGVGLSGIAALVTVPSAPSLPSMSFGGSFRRPGMRGMGGRSLIVNGGPTIQ